MRGGVGIESGGDDGIFVRASEHGGKLPRHFAARGLAERKHVRGSVLSTGQRRLRVAGEGNRANSFARNLFFKEQAGATRAPVFVLAAKLLGFAGAGAVADIFDDVLNRGNGHGNVNVVAVVLHVHVDFSVVNG